MIKLLLIALPLLVTACATQQALNASGSKNALIVVGTLADANNPFDMAAAPVITQATVVRRSALRALKNQRITADTARLAQQCADNVMNAVNSAVDARDKVAINRSADYAKACQYALDKAKEH